MTGDAGPLALLVREFGAEWEISVRPAGLRMTTAYRETDGGRHRRYLVAATAIELLERLRAVSREEAAP